MSFEPPKLGAPCPPHHSSGDALALLTRRRSSAAPTLGDPGPSADTLSLILRIGARVPDHRRVNPFRFIVIEGEARARAGDVLANVYSGNNPQADEEAVELERSRFERAPVVVAVVAATVPEHKTPEWEQILTVGAVCQNMLIAASASGFAAQWLTEWCAYDGDVLSALGLSESERIAGYIYIGTAQEAPVERPRPELEPLITRF